MRGAEYAWQGGGAGAAGGAAYQWNRWGERARAGERNGALWKTGERESERKCWKTQLWKCDAMCTAARSAGFWTENAIGSDGWRSGTSGNVDRRTQIRIFIRTKLGVQSAGQKKKRVGQVTADCSVGQARIGGIADWFRRMQQTCCLSRFSFSCIVLRKLYKGFI